jgi:hypothetical protein
MSDELEDDAFAFQREAFGKWHFETFSVKAYMLGTSIVACALTP